MTPIPPPPPPPGRPASIPPPPPTVQAAAPQPPSHDQGVPDHVKRLLTARGDHDPTANAWRTMRIDRCRDCRAVIGIALDELGLTRTVDPTPLTEHGELQAVIGELGTYTLTTRDLDPRRLQLSFRRGYQDVSSRPAPTDYDAQIEADGGSRTYDVVADHRCGIGRDHHQRTASVIDRRHHQVHDDPPF